MKILLASYTFLPAVGGIETVGRLLAREWTALGHEVVVMTLVKERPAVEEPYRIERAPSFLRKLELLAWADVVLENNISLALTVPWLFTAKPLFVVHHTWFADQDAAPALWSRAGLSLALKRAIVGVACNISVSRVMLSYIGRGYRIPNPFDTAVFRRGEFAAEVRGLLFVGRLTHDKGVDIFIDALGRLHRQGIDFSATVVGDGAEYDRVVAQARENGIEGKIRFTGFRSGAALAALYRAHRYVVVPSRWQEPFGLVALEAIACGCIPVVAEVGGLPEAAGPDALCFKRKNSADLALVLARALVSGDSPDPARVQAHLGRHEPASVAAKYLDLFQTHLATGSVV